MSDAEPGRPTGDGRPTRAIQVLVVLGIAALVAVGVFLVLRDGRDTMAAPTTQPTGTTAPSETTAATAVETTTTVAPPATEIGPGTFPVDIGTLEVVGVEPDDVLNVRSGPGTQNDVIGAFPHNYSGVVTTGTGATSPDGAQWWEVEFFDDIIGWVNSAFLEPVAPTSAPFSAYPCGTAPEDYVFSGVVATSPASPSDADHVFSIDHSSHPDCERTVITLGSDYDFDDDFADTLSPTDRVSGGIAVRNDGSFFNIDLVGIESVRTNA
ncbi:MAG: SH3 domain-containing protein, partial [Acidimicrobiia bacterium]